MEPGPKPPTKNEESPPTPEPKAEPTPKAKTEEPGQEQATQTVVAEGVGTDDDKALKDAFRNAVRQAVGAVVDAETLVKNDDVIKDQVLTYSDGFITKYDVQSTKKEDGLVRTTIQATVERRKLIQKLQAANVTVKKMEGQSLFAEAVTQQDAKANATQLLKKALEGLPTMLTAEMVGKPKYDADKGEAILEICIKPDRKAFDAFRERLEQVLEKIALRKESLLVDSGEVRNRRADAQILGSIHYFAPPNEKSRWCVWVASFIDGTGTKTRWNGYLLNADARQSTQSLLGRTEVSIAVLDSAETVVTESLVILERTPLKVYDGLYAVSCLQPLRCFLCYGSGFASPRWPSYYQQEYQPLNVPTLDGGKDSVTFMNVFIGPFFLGFEEQNSSLRHAASWTMPLKVKLPSQELKRVTDVRCKVTFRPDADK